MKKKNYDALESPLLHTTFLRNRSTGSWVEDILKIFNIGTWQPTWSCDHHHISYYSFIISLHLKQFTNTYKNWLKLEVMFMKQYAPNRYKPRIEDIVKCKKVKCVCVFFCVLFVCCCFFVVFLLLFFLCSFGGSPVGSGCVWVGSGGRELVIVNAKKHIYKGGGSGRRGRVRSGMGVGGGCWLVG